MTRNQKGFTLIELLIVVAIIGILAAIAIPNLLTAMQRSKQKRTMADIRTLATGWEARATDVNRYNAAGTISAVTQVTKTVTATQLSGALSPTYIKMMPAKDGWGIPLNFFVDQTWGAADTPAQAYLIISAGKDATFEGAGAVGGATTNFDNDIIYGNGSFLQYPEGVQTQ